MNLLREKQVIELTKLSRMTLWRMEKENRFPRRIRIGRGTRGAVGWLESEIQAWLQEKAAARQGAAE